MKFRPILFSTPMIQAILAGRKTQTRRLIKVDPELEWLGLQNPKYQPGDILWVRETWKPGAWREDGRVAFDYKASPDLIKTPWTYHLNFESYFQKWTDEIIKNGSTPDANGFHHWEPGKSPLSWKPSIHMPKEVARIFLKVTGVRVDKLQGISAEDAVAEGVESRLPDSGIAQSQFQELWTIINGPDSWNQNPYVWVYSFERIDRPENFLEI